MGGKEAIERLGKKAAPKVTWYVEVPEQLDKLVERAVEEGHYRTKVELIRSAVRKELERLGLLPR